MDLNDLEEIDLNALGGVDLVTVNDLSGTDVSKVNVNLAGTSGGAVGDGAADVVTQQGTNGNDSIDVVGAGTSVSVVGLSAQLNMLIVPEADVLSVEAKVSPQDIDQLRLGQTAALRFSALNQRTTPEISGTVSRVSADVSADQRSGQSFYTVRIALSSEETARLGDVKLVPGMPVEAFMKTYDRTVLSYFIKPLQDQVMRAFRER